MKTRKKTPNIEIANLDAAIAATRQLIARHHEALRNLDTKLLNQLAEFHRQSTKTVERASSSFNSGTTRDGRSTRTK